MLVLDDFLNKDSFLMMRAAIMAASFPWERSLVVSHSGLQTNGTQHIQDVHGFFLHNNRIRFQSPRFSIIQPVIQKLAPKVLIRAKVNRTQRQDRHIEYGMHVDTRCPGAVTAVYYLNDNNGHTHFEDGTNISSIANRLVLFDASRMHTAVSCTDAKCRLVLNINMMGPELLKRA